MTDEQRQRLILREINDINDLYLSINYNVDKILEAQEAHSIDDLKTWLYRTLNVVQEVEKKQYLITNLKSGDLEK